MTRPTPDIAKDLRDLKGVGEFTPARAFRIPFLLREAADRLEQQHRALEKYAWHVLDDPICPAVLIDDPGPCTCGYDEARAALGGDEQ